MRLFKIIMFFSRFPGLDLLILFCCILFVTTMPMSPFKIYDLLKNGKVTTGEVTQVTWMPTGSYIDYQYTTQDGILFKDFEKTFDLAEYGIHKNKFPQKIEIVYVPERPELSWIKTARPYYNVETFWKDYFIENSLASLVLYTIFITIIGINQYLDRRKSQKEALGFE